MRRFSTTCCTGYLLPFAIGVLLPGCTGGTPHDVCGTVLAFEGSVTITEHQAGQPHSVDPGSYLCAGATLRTSAASSAQIACLASTHIHISAETALQIDRLTLRKDGNETGDEVEARLVRCRLTTGVIYISHERPWGSSELTVATPYGTLTASSHCLVRVQINSQMIRITCARGVSGFQPADGQPALAVKAGFICEWPSSQPVPVVAADDAAGQKETDELIAAEQLLNALATARQLAPPPWTHR